MKKFSTYKGFTLVELMIVIAIIGILAAVLYPSLTGYLEKTRDTKRQSDVRAISQAVSQYYSDRNKFPGDVNTVCPDEIKDDIANTDAKTGSQYIKALPKDDKMKVVTNGNTCSSGYGYKWIKQDENTTTKDGQSSIVSASMENKANASMLRATYQADALNAVTAVSMTPKSDASNKDLYEGNGLNSKRWDWILTQTQE